MNQRYGLLQEEYNSYAACGAFKEHTSDSIELKRIYVEKEYRRHGYAKLIVQELEALSKSKEYAYTLLETGRKQPEAINLYQSMGYCIIDNFKPYIDNGNSVCMKKKLG